MKSYGKIAMMAGAVAAMTLCSCSQKSNMTTITVPSSTVSGLRTAASAASPVREFQGKTQNMVLKASAFKMSGDYSDNVAVTVGADGKLTYFPAPTDIRKTSRPIDLGNGWWLNRQGLSANSVFTRWTFDEYSKLKETPSVQEIMEAIIPGATVTEMRVLPIPAAQAQSKLGEIKQMLAE